MAGIPATSEGSSRGGTSVVLFVFAIVAFLLTIAVDAAYLRYLSAGPAQRLDSADEFDSAPLADLIQPSPQLSPSEVVEIQLAGLADPNPSRGIQQCFEFASPSNRQSTGPLTRFAAMLRRPPYAVLMRRQMLLVGESFVESKTASVVVTLLDESEGLHVFQFLLAKQHGGDLENCWMTDAVFPLEQVPKGSADRPDSAGYQPPESTDEFVGASSEFSESTRG
jgi:hypothetical protein